MGRDAGLSVGCLPGAEGCGPRGGEGEAAENDDDGRRRGVGGMLMMRRMCVGSVQ
jgi:hypothetical protein